MTRPQQNNVVKLLRNIRGKPVPNHPTGLPAQPDNTDTVVDGQYSEEGTTDPGIQHGVTGSGSGPIIGSG